MLTVQAALDTGLPLYVGCKKCDAPSRQVDLQGLLAAGKGDLDLEAFAQRGGFRCGICGASGGIMPMMDLLLRERVRWHERCITCGKERYMTGVEAIAAYGLGVPFDAVRRVVRSRCSAAGCHMNSGIGPRSTAPALPPVPFVRKPRREPEWPNG